MNATSSPTAPAGTTTRPLTLDDVDGTFEVYSAAQLHDTGVPGIERADIVADWSRPSIDLAHDTIGVLDGDRIVAAAEVTRYGTRGEVAVHPDARGRGIGTWLAEWVEAKAVASGAALVGQTVPDGSAGQRLLEDRGYRLGHTSWVLELPEGARIEDRPLPEGYRIRTSETEEDHRAAQAVIERAFGEWANRPEEPYEEWAPGVIGRPGYQPWHLRLVEHDGDGVVGVCFTVLDEWGAGYVDQLAVAREHRNQGLARALLADGFRNAREHGAERSELATDSRTGALDLYLLVGMRVTQTWTHLVTDLPRTAG